MDKNLPGLWKFDGDATHYICNDMAKFAVFNKKNDGKRSGTDRSKATIKIVGTIREQVVLFNGDKRDIEIKDTLFVPSMIKSLLSVPHINNTEMFQVVFDGSKTHIARSTQPKS